MFRIAIDSWRMYATASYCMPTLNNLIRLHQILRLQPGCARLTWRFCRFSSAIWVITISTLFRSPRSLMKPDLRQSFDMLWQVWTTNTCTWWNGNCNLIIVFSNISKLTATHRSYRFVVPSWASCTNSVMEIKPLSSFVTGGFFMLFLEETLLFQNLRRSSSRCLSGNMPSRDLWHCLSFLIKLTQRLGLWDLQASLCVESFKNSRSGLHHPRKRGRGQKGQCYPQSPCQGHGWQCCWVAHLIHPAIVEPQVSEKWHKLEKVFNPVFKAGTSAISRNLWALDNLVELIFTWVCHGRPQIKQARNKVWNDLLPFDAKVLKIISSSDSMSKFARLKLLRLQRVAETAGNSRKWTKLNEDYPYQDELLIPSVFSPCADNTVVAGLVSRLFEGGDSKPLVFLQRVLVAPWMNSGTSCRVGMS